MKKEQEREQARAHKISLLLFKINNEYYAINLNETSGIIEDFKIVKIPYTPEYISGVINMKGNIVSVIDIRKILWLEQPSSRIKHMICIVKFDKLRIGILIDTIFNIIEISEKQVQPPLSTIEKVKREYVIGQIEVEGKIATLLDIRNALKTEVKELL